MSKTRLIEAVKQLDLQETKRILAAKPELLKHGASPDIADREGATARQKASRKRNKKFLAALN